MFIASMPVAGLKPASYNPRKIADDSLDALRASISLLGFCKPIIVSDSRIIIAGHQRTKASMSMGMTHVPAFIVRDGAANEEVIFNQLHNGSDVDRHAGEVTVPRDERLGFGFVNPMDIRCMSKMPGAEYRAAICRLTNIYGPWGAAVATQSGRVLASRQVAAAYKTLRQPLRVFRIPDEHEEAAAGFMGREYGEYSYDHIERHTYIQTLAQLFRLRNSDGAKRSSLYERMVLKDIDATTRVLDFGCGQGDYVDQLSGLKYDIQGVEFFFRDGKSIDTVAVHRMITNLCDVLRRKGLFDVTVCDSVLNSTNSLQAEADVLTCLNAFTRPGGHVYFSGRNIKSTESIFKASSAVALAQGDRTFRAFLDKDGFSGYLRNGIWFFQKFHSADQCRALAAKYIGEIVSSRIDDSIWRIKAKKTVELPVCEIEASISREFNLDWPENKRIGRHEDALGAWHSARGITS